MAFKHRKTGKLFSESDEWTLGTVENNEDREAALSFLKHQAARQGTLRERAKRAAADLNGGNLPAQGTKRIDDPTITEREWYARQISEKADELSTWLDMMNHQLGTKLTEEDVQTIIGPAFALGRIMREAELKYKWGPLTEHGLTFKNSKRGPSELHQTIERILQPDDSNEALLDKLRMEAAYGSVIIQAVDEDDDAEVWVYWRTHDGREKKTGGKAVFNMAANIRKKWKGQKT